MLSRRTNRFIFLLVAICGSALLLWLSFRSAPQQPITSWNRTNALRPDQKFHVSDSGNPETLVQALDHSISYYKAQKETRQFSFGPQTVETPQVLRSLEVIRAKLVELGLSDEFFKFVQDNYLGFGSASETVLFTGYYEPLLHGSREKSDKYYYPLYTTPADLLLLDIKKFPYYNETLWPSSWPTAWRLRLTENNVLLPYYTRTEIDQLQRLANRKLEIIWVDSEVDAFFLQVQGSGRVQLPDGSSVRVGYAEKNGHPYKAIGNYLLQQNLLEKGNVNLQSIKAFLAKNPDRVAEVLNFNPSYVFFKENRGEPLGNLGKPVTAFRSIATDANLMPPGALALIELELPTFDAAGQQTGKRKFSQLVLNQDTGGAIKGPGRVDLFTGFGKESELIAGNLQSQGKLTFLLLK